MDNELIATLTKLIDCNEECINNSLNNCKDCINLSKYKYKFETDSNLESFKNE